ncbi:efflux RND transporter periplasmic adaptor subunit [Fodinibius halophilus]|uniref:Efflux RND transporter periplasmic adaptor subunit n=1 Tax=Fodinibius halophilus TaxID=1736908 RepID=A0A6M1SYY0_9BACT|nr:efflux RND transporter periplasmic adaptor subunit [Fodinibius halophilus]NGP86839.1 efflux RND transporter periplasmic adaptor subunit [Fodinibius halophilus]
MNFSAKRLALGLVGLCAVFISSCSTETQSKDVMDKDSTAAVPVEVATANTGDISAYYSSTTTLEADEEATVVAKVRGLVETLHVEEGDIVQAGDLLAQLEDEQLRLEAQQAKATMDRLKNELNRKKELYQKELISAQEFENAKYEFQAQKSSYELAQLQLNYTQITAPINGIISDRMIKVGNMINSDQEVFQITDFDPLLAVLDIPEHEMNKLNKGQSAKIKVDAIPGATFSGRVLRISPTVNSETGTFEVTVSIKDESRKLKPGMFGRVRIVYDTHQNTLMIPKNAVMTEDGASSVYVINDKMAYRQNVRTGYINGDNIEIIEGINPADTVVTVGQNSLQDSALVEIVSY